MCLVSKYAQVTCQSVKLPAVSSMASLGVISRVLSAMSQSTALTWDQAAQKRTKEGLEAGFKLTKIF